MGKNMPKKSIRQMSAFMRKHHSLQGKTVRAIVLLAAIMGVFAIAFGFILYNYAVQRDYRTNTYNLSKTAAKVLDLVTIRKKAKEVLSIYDSLSPEEQLDDDSEEYRALFRRVEDMDHNTLRLNIYDLQITNGAIAGYVAALDLEKNRMIFIADGDQKASYCPPGTWDAFKPKHLKTFMEGSKRTALDVLNGTPSMRAIILTMEQYGYRCTAGTKLFQVNGYPVFIFYDTDMNQAAKTARTFLLQYIGLLLIIAVVTGLFIIRYMKKHIVKPINELADAAYNYAKGKEREEGTDVRYFENLDIRTGDEIENLSLTMKDMERETFVYLQNLTKVTAEKERISTELDVAQQIQEGIVPHIYPAFPGFVEFDVYASMTPAKEVGGDFYDFFMIDDDHLALIMADVSGKGIPAALFMMGSKIMIKNTTLSGISSPAEILQSVNEQICQGNDAEMFVTVWLGILELSTGKLVCASAGHEYPVIYRKDSGYAIYKDKHGLVIGAIDQAKYKNYELLLNPGDGLFVYTDGVPETTNADRDLFGTARMVDVLNQNPHNDMQEVLTHMKEQIDLFAAEAPQFDDITMLSLVYYGPNKQ